MLSIISSLSWSHSNVFIKPFLWHLCVLSSWQKSTHKSAWFKQKQICRFGFWTQLCITKPTQSYHRVWRTNVLQVQKGQQCNYCIAVNDKQKLFFCPKAWTKMIRDSHCWTPAIQIFSEWLWHRNVAFSTLAWFLTLCSQSQRQTVLI